MLRDVSESELFSTISTVVKLVAKDPDLLVRVESDFLTDLGLSSLNMIMLLTEVCERMKLDIFRFSESDLAGVKRVCDLVALLKAKG